MGMTNEEREKHIRIANMLIGAINDLIRPILMYQIEKDVTKEALENYIKMLEQQPCEDAEEYGMNEQMESSSEKPNKSEILTGWIPVSERLPKAGEYIGNVAKYYLVQNEYGDMMIARFTHSEYWEQIYQLKPIADKIIAWMPLPELYKAESEDTVNKTGHWIDIMVGDIPAQACDQCNTFYPLAYTGGGHRFCPNCGAKMIEPQESEDNE